MEKNRKKRIVGIIVSVFPLITIILYAILAQYNIEDNQIKKCSMNRKKETNGKNEKEAKADNGWKVELDIFENRVLGSNLSYYNGWCTEGDGYIYTLNMAFYGEEEEDNDHSTIYRFDKSKNQWEIVVSYAMPQEEFLREDGVIIYDRYVRDLAYYEGFVYYILVNDQTPGEGLGKEYYFYRVSEQNGEVEKIGEGFDRFYIYNNKVYYMTQSDFGQILYFWEMDIDGNSKKLIYYKSSESYYRGGETFAVGGGSLYWVDGNDSIRAINMKTKKEKIFAVNLDYGIEGIYYETGNLYIDEVFIYQLNLNSGDIKKIVEPRRDAVWIHNGYLYYVDHITNDNHYNYCFWRRNLLTDEVIKWHEISIPQNTNIHMPYVHLEVAGCNILVQVETDYLLGNDYDQYEYSYFIKKLDELE